MSIKSNEERDYDELGPVHDKIGLSLSKQTTTKSDPPILQVDLKRKRLDTFEDSSEDDTPDVDDDARGTTLAKKCKKRRPTGVMTAVKVPPMVFPKSAYCDFERTTSVSDERDILKEAMSSISCTKLENQSHGGEEFVAFDIENFTIYRPHKPMMAKKRKVLEEQPLSNEMIGLHEIDGRGMKHWFLDGWICYGNHRNYVQRIPCEKLSIGNYEDTDVHGVGSAIWVQSWLGQRSDVWYCVKEPAPEYRPYHEAFLWMADFTKHMIDYLYEHKAVTLHHFKEDFYSCIDETHGFDQNFQQWQKTYADTDFRRVLATHPLFVYNQARQLGEEYTSHPLWSEIDPNTMDAVPKQTEQVKTYRDEEPKQRSKKSRSKTIVTPFVYECFKHLPWSRFLDVQRPVPAVLRLREKEKYRKPNVNFHPILDESIDSSSASQVEVSQQKMLCVGDVVAINSDKTTTWKSNDSIWYGYVQGLTHERKGTRLHLLWLYRPSDTACQKMRYPFAKEMFLSDHCNCGDYPIYATEVIDKPKVAFFGGPDTPSTDFFVRQKYNGVDSAWTTLRLEDFQCVCRKSKIERRLCVGDTWLVARKTKAGEKTLEPVELSAELCDGQQKIRVRRLLRLGRDFNYEHADANELVYSSRFEDIAKTDFFRPCQIRFYTVDTRDSRQIPAPYSMRGTADAYYITHGCDDNGDVQPLSEPWPASLNQGFDPMASPLNPVMRGLDIFCGGGTLGRGLEDGGSVKMEWAVDYFREAIHTYRANVEDTENVKLFYGSVNDYLSQAMKGKRSNLIAQNGEVDLIAAGSPCQGFSLANKFKTEDNSLINVSMVASVVSFVDFYRPKYAILENVPNMANCGAKDQENNVFAQVLSSLVGMGYQAQPYLLDAWNFGCPQSRTRLFVSITAPGLTPLPDPPQSHSHPDGVTARALGKTANGLPLGTRYWDLTPFEYVTIKEATRDLPPNQHGKTTCIPHPDHRLSRNVSALNQGRIECVPKHPEGMNFIKAFHRGVMGQPQIEAYSWDAKFRSEMNCRAWQRVFPNALTATITTVCVVEDGIAGMWLHWEADRPLTIMEARRAQGFPDREVIVGAPSMQWKIVGNSVARPVAVALGVSLRKAWLANIEAAAHDPAKVPMITGEGTEITHAHDTEHSKFTAGSISKLGPIVSTPQKGLTRAEIAVHQTLVEGTSQSTSSKAKAPAQVKPPKARTLNVATPSPTTDKRLRSGPQSDDLVMLPKTQRGPITPVGQSWRAKPETPETIEISSDDDDDDDDEPPSDDTAVSTAETSQAHDSTRETTSSNPDGDKMAIG